MKIASCAAGNFFGLLDHPADCPVPCLRDHTPAPQGRRRLTLFRGGAEIRRSRLRSLKSVLDVLWVPAARPATRHFRAEHVAGKARSGGPPVRLGPKALQGPSSPPRASRSPDLKTFLDHMPLAPLSTTAPGFRSTATARLKAPRCSSGCMRACQFFLKKLSKNSIFYPPDRIP
jgi:hypothetical protein